MHKNCRVEEESGEEEKKKKMISLRVGPVFWG